MVAQGQKFVADSISRWIDMTSGPFGMPLASGEAPFGGLFDARRLTEQGFRLAGGTARLAEGLRAEGHGRNERGERRVTLPVEDLGVNAYGRLGSTYACGSTRPGSAFSSPPTPPRSANPRRDVASADDVRRSLMDARSGCATSAVSECAHFEGSVAPARKVSRSRVIGQLRGMMQIHDPDAPNGERPVAAGRNADAPHDIPARGWLQVLKRVKTESVADNASLLAGGVAFFALLAIVPLLVAALSIWGLFASPTDATRLIRDIATGLPHSAQRLIMQQLRSITRRSNGGLSITAAISLLIALWSASSGTKHLIEAVNAAYDEDEERGFVRVRALALVLTIGAIVFAFVAIALIAVVPTAIADAGVPRGARIVIDIAIWVLLAFMMMGALAVIYRVGPDRRDPAWRWVSWGAVIATVAWLIGSALFALYASNVGNYDQTYGSLGGVVVLMLWLFLTALVVILGAELNAELEAQTARDTTVGPERPRGDRDATAADTLASEPSRRTE